MKKTFSSLIAIILVVATFASILPITVMAAETNSEYFPKYTGKSSSLVDALKAVGVNSSFSNRKTIAVKNGFPNYTGTASENTKLLSLLKQGKLKNPSYTPPAAGTSNSGNSNSTGNVNSSKYYPKYTGSSGSIATALKSLGIDSSYTYRTKIAKINSIGNPYTGTAAQNTEMLSRLRKGTLIRAEYIETNSFSQPVSKGVYYDIKSTVSIKAQPYEAASTVYKIAKGETVRVEETVKNSYGNVWYKVYHYTKNGVKEGYIYSGHLVKHNHKYEFFKFDAIEYSVCACGDMKAYSKNPAKAKEGVVILETASITVGLPIVIAGGEALKALIETSIYVIAVCLAHDISVSWAREHINTLSDTIEDIAEKEKNECTLYSYRKVVLVENLPNQLMFVDEECMTILEAFIYIYATGGNIYTSTREGARELAKMWGCGVGEISPCNLYYYHYHLEKIDPDTKTCNDKRYAGHIFCGASPAGFTPIDPFAIQ